MLLDKLKTRARNLQRAMQEALKQPIKLSLAYELIAKEEGFENWDTACAMLQPAAPVETVKSGASVITAMFGTKTQQLHEALIEAVPGAEQLSEFEAFHELSRMNWLHMHLDTGTAPSKQQVSAPGMQAVPNLERAHQQKTHRHTIHSADREALLCKLSSLKAAGYALERYLHLPQDQFTEERFDDLLAELDDADRSTRRLANSLRDDLSIAGARKIARHIKMSEADILWFEREAARNRAKGNHFVADNYHRSVLLIRKRLSEKLIPMQQNLNRTTDN
ncbi:glyoxalase superfamily protein (plasmid) [Pseudomonas silesiensis]|uniref:glyoxalase superfamily protein n=1 Tax=Pseudomonas silesiensis TaxID=1853130 RepID=UPI0030CCCE0D